MSTVNTRSRDAQVIRKNKAGHYLLTPSQLAEVRVNVPNSFVETGISVVFAQTAAGMVNVGLTDSPRVEKFKPIDDLGKLFQIKKLVQSPEARKEREENKILLQNFVFNTMVRKAIDAKSVVVRNGLDTELTKFAMIVENLELNSKVFQAAPRITPIDEFLANFCVDQIDRIHDSIMAYLMEFVSSENREKVPLKNYLIETGVTSWMYSKLALTKIDVGADQNVWSLFFKTSMEKSFTVTLEEALSETIKEQYLNFPGFNDVAIYAAATSSRVDDMKMEDAAKVRLFVLPRGLEYHLLRKGVQPSRSLPDTTKYKDYSRIWNTSRLGLLGIATPDGSREGLNAQLFGIDISQDEKVDIPSMIRDKEDMELFHASNENEVYNFFRNVGAPTRLSATIKELQKALFPIEEIRGDDGKVAGEVPYLPAKTIGGMLKLGIEKFQFKKYVRENAPLHEFVKAARDKDDFEMFMKSTYFKKNLEYVPKDPKLRGAGSFLSKRARNLVTIIGQKEEYQHLAVSVENFLGSFKLQEMMDLAANEIAGHLRSKAHLQYEDDDDSGEGDNEDNYFPGL